MKKFDLPFDSYELGPERPISIELHPQGLARYSPLFNNPIYYFHAFQYTNGSFYRAIFGYETLWDKEHEDTLVRSLDLHLTILEQRTEYYLEEIEFVKDSSLHALIWQRGIKPKVIVNQLYPIKVPKGTRALARINLVDKPNHVDVEFLDGQIITLKYIHYLRWKRNHIRSLYEKKRRPQSKQSRTDAKNGQCGKAEATQAFSREFTLGTLAPEVLNLRQRFRRFNSLRKAR